MGSMPGLDAFACVSSQHFEAILQYNGGSVEAPGHMVGSSITAADLAVFHFLAAAEQHFKEYYDAVDAPLCKAFKASIQQRPNIAAYLQSERCQPWDTDSMM
jgi:glutathione S-transferase